MSVSRAWYRTISESSCLWETLKLDGSINRLNAIKKVKWWSEKVLGVEGAQSISKGISSGRGLKQLVITAAGHLKMKELFEVIRDAGIADRLENLTVSYVDSPGALSNDWTGSCDWRGVYMEGFLLDTCRLSIKSLTWCSPTRIEAYDSLPDTNLFPRLSHLNVFAEVGEARRSSIFPLLSLPLDTRIIATSPLVSLRLVNVILRSEQRDLVFEAPHLRYLEVCLHSDTPLASSPWSDFIVGLPGLKQFKMSGTATFFTGVGWVPRNLQSLEDLSLDCYLIGNRMIDALVKVKHSLANLTRLSLSKMLLSENFEEFEYLNCPSLLHLSLSHNSNIRAQAAAFPSLPKLLTLQLQHESWLTNDFVDVLSLRTPQLRTLNLDNNYSLTGSPLMRFVQSRTEPSDSIPLVEGESVEAGKDRKNFSSLEELSLVGCKGVEDGAVKWLGKHIRPGGFKWTFLEAGETVARGNRWN